MMQDSAAPALAAEAAALFTREVHTAPTLVKYAQPNEYLVRTEPISPGSPPSSSRPASMPPLRSSISSSAPSRLKSSLPLRFSTPRATTPTARFATFVAGLPAARSAEIIDLGLKHRGKHDETLRAFHAGASLRFDILMDIGGFRDLHRHRRCVQIIQGFTGLHGYETPGVGDLPRCDRHSRRGRILSEYRPPSAPPTWPPAPIAASHAPEAPQSALYLLPLATRIRASSKWTSPRLSTSPNCAPAPPATSATAASHGRCT